MKFFGTMRWVAYFVLAIAGTGGAGAYWFYSRSDELLKTEILNQLAVMFPETEFELDRAIIEWSGKVRAYQVRMTLPGEDYAALTVAELVITLDRDQLAETQSPSIQRVRLIKPRAWLVRHSDRTWNWQLLRKRKSENTLPDLEIEHGTLTVQFEQDSSQPPIDVNCTELKLTATPSSDRSFSIVASSRIDGAAPLRVEGEFALDGSPWTATAEVDGFLIDQALIGRVLAIQPEWKRPVDEAEARWALLAAGEFPRQSPTVAANLAKGQRASDGVYDLGVQLVTDVKVRLGSAAEGGAPTFQLKADIRNGRLTNKMLPLPLHELTGKIYADRSQVVLQELEGRHGESTVTCSAKWSAKEQPAATIRARQIVLDDTLTARLPESLRKLIRTLDLQGQCDFDAQITRTANVYIPDLELTLTRGSLMYEKFAYPVRDVSGKLTWHGDLAHLEGRGMAGTAPVSVTGTIKQPGRGAEMVIDIEARDVPIDATLLQASPAVVRTAITAIDLKGVGDAKVRLIKPAGVGTKPVPHIVARLRDCSALFNKFPLRVDRITGLVRWDGETATFENLRGRHADADVSCDGTFVKSPNPGRLALEFHVTNAPFDSELHEALPVRLRDAWDEFDPAGRFDAVANVAWSPGGEVELSLPIVRLKDGEVTLRHFPFPWRGVSGELSYAHELLTVRNLRAEHDDCRLRAAGEGAFPLNRPWQFQFTEFFVDDLPTTPAFRRALPAELRTVIDALNPTGTVSVQGPMMFFGPDERRDSVALKWKSDIHFSGSNLSLGQRVENIYGRVTIQGRWDGAQTVIERGDLDLDSLKVLQHELREVKGPFRYQQGELIAGSQQAVVGSVAEARRNVRVDDQINAKVIDGTLTCNALVNFNDPEPRYRMRLMMIDGNLKRYAQIYLNGQKDILGNINGWADLQGQGDDADLLTGSGHVDIEPAELYDLPVFFQMFQMLGPQFQDRAAFKRASFTFTVGKQRFKFDSIDLAGNTIRMYGKGFVRFDGIVDLEFYSELARNQFGVPIVKDLIGMLSRGWVGVTISGYIKDPDVKTRAIPELDDTLKQFLGAFDPRLSTAPPRTFAPRTGQSPPANRR